jgi:hypothetical protein
VVEGVKKMDQDKARGHVNRIQRINSLSSREAWAIVAGKKCC